MADKNTIKNWFKTNLIPTQAQFWALFDSYRHNDEKIPITAIDDIENILAEKADAEVLAHHLTDVAAHADLFDAKEDKSKRGAAYGYAPLNEFTKLAIDYLNVVNDLVTGGESSLLTAEQGKLLQTQINNINVLLASDNVNLDNVQEIVDAIETVQMSLSSILVNDLTTGGTTKALTAEMGKLLDLAKENLSNKATIILEGTNESSNTLYPTVKAVYDWGVARFQKLLLNIETTPAIIYTLDYTNSIKRTVFTSSNPVSFTVPTNSSSPIPVGARRELTAQGDGIVTIGGAGITFTTNLSLVMVKGETRVLTKIATDTWTVEGNNALSGAKTPYTYYVDSVNGSNATGAYQDASKPFATIDYVMALTGLVANSKIQLMSAGIYYVNGVFNDKVIEINSDYACTISLANNTLTSVIFSNATNLKINIPKGIADFRSTAVKDNSSLYGCKLDIICNTYKMNGGCYVRSTPLNLNARFKSRKFP